MALSLALVDDHQLFREAFRALLAIHPDLHVVGEAGTAREGCAMVEERQPEVVVIDIAMPGMSGLDAAREIRRRQARRKILFLSMHKDEEFVAQALAAGAKGYAFKEQSADAVLEAIRTVGRGQEYLPPRISRFALDEQLARVRNGSGGPLDPLSPREKEVFGLLVHGSGNDAIAVKLDMSVKTAETHRSRILKKLGVHTLADLVRFAARHGFL